MNNPFKAQSISLAIGFESSNDIQILFEDSKVSLLDFLASRMEDNLLKYDRYKAAHSLATTQKLCLLLNESSLGLERVDAVKLSIESTMFNELNLEEYLVKNIFFKNARLLSYTVNDTHRKLKNTKNVKIEMSNVNVLRLIGTFAAASEDLNTDRFKKFIDPSILKKIPHFPVIIQQCKM